MPFLTFNKMPLNPAEAGLTEASTCAEAVVHAGCDTSIRNRDGKTGRDLAQRNGHTAVLNRLAVLQEANVGTAKEVMAMTPLHPRSLAVAAQSGDRAASTMRSGEAVTSHLRRIGRAARAPIARAGMAKATHP